MRLSRDESGIIVIFAALLLVTIVAVVSIVLNSGYAGVISTEAQVAADAAALAGAGTLCSTKQCWANSKRAAIEVFNRHRVHGSLGDNADLEIDTFDDGPEWNLGGLRIRIERGRWWSDEKSFESFEDVNWQAENPGAPDFASANSVRVLVERQNVDMFLNPFSADDELTYTVERESVAGGGAMGQVCVAPFAIPMCALLNEQGDFNPAEECQYDRLFTAADRYCENGENCNVLPSHFWHPTDINPHEIAPPHEGDISGLRTTFATQFCPPQYWGANASNVWYCPLSDDPDWEPGFWNMVMESIMSPCPGLGMMSPFDQQYECALSRFHQYQSQLSFRPKLYQTATQFGNYKQPTTSDHYGLVGLPIGPGVPSLDGADDEQDVRSILGGNPPCVMAEIGQKFRILGEGLTETETDEVLWSQIQNRVVLDEDTHPTFIGSKQLGRLILSYKTHAFNGNPMMTPGQYGPAIGRSRAEFYDRSNAWGVCNSHRLGYRGMFGETFPDATSSCSLSAVKFFGQNEDIFVTQDRDEDTDVPLQENGRVWRISVPVISQSCKSEAVPSCQGVNGASSDPPIDPEQDYEICGFVSVLIFDVDIGYPPPNFPREACSRDSSSCGTSGGPGTCWDTNNFHYPWGFDVAAQSTGPAVKQPTNCNMVRSRIACDTGLMASAEHRSKRTPLLVQ